MSEMLAPAYFNRSDQNPQIVEYLGQYSYLDLNGVESDSPAERRMLLSEGVLISKPSGLQPNEPDGTIIMPLEPHPDDFALSASGYALRQIQAGSSCQVVNLFSGTAIERFPWAAKVTISEQEFEDLRLLESRLAVEELLGQTFESLRLPLASRRGYSEIFGSSHRDQELVVQTGEMLVEKTVEAGIGTVLAPMAIQGHIDHLVTFDVAMHLKQALGDKVELLLYEDYPYARNKRAYQERLGWVASKYVISAEYVATDGYIDTMADIASIYRSQFDDLNRDQMLALMREDGRAVKLEAAADGIDVPGECAQRYWRVA
jgi:LmbE family N-acetylglucosaminyl deacetylase